MRASARRLRAHHAPLVCGRLESLSGRQAARAHLVAHLVPLRADGRDQVGPGGLGLVRRVRAGVVEVDDVFVVAWGPAVGARVLEVLRIFGVLCIVCVLQILWVELECLGALLEAGFRF